MFRGSLRAGLRHRGAHQEKGGTGAQAADAYGRKRRDGRMTDASHWHTMKNQLLPPTGLLFSSLAVLSLSVMTDDSKKSEKESDKAADNSAKNERDKEG